MSINKSVCVCTIKHHTTASVIVKISPLTFVSVSHIAGISELSSSPVCVCACAVLLELGMSVINVEIVSNNGYR